MDSCTDNIQHIKQSTHLHWYHWLVFVLSLVLTFSAWYYTKTQIDDKVKNSFEREANKTIELIMQRMSKYEDMLWSAAGLFRSSQSVSEQEWEKFAETISVEKKYPGINGIGAIALVHKSHYQAFIKQHRVYRPEFNIHPYRQGEYYLPITFIEPEKGNVEAIGLDMAHEKNRFEAALRTIQTGQASITGPITLVQDSGKTPGFLFFVPIKQIQGDLADASMPNDDPFTIVYAPFVVKKLMEGTLSGKERRVSLRITDKQSTIYNENQANYPKYDPNPLFKIEKNIDWYGRQWSFEIFSDLEFRSYAQNYQPLTILIGGLTIDVLLLILFFYIVRSNKKAYAFAREATLSLREKTDKLEKSNAELEKFAYVASHDLKAPLRGIENIIHWIEEDSLEDLDKATFEHLQKIKSRVKRMNCLVKGILEYSVIKKDSADEHREIDTQAIMKEFKDQYDEQHQVALYVPQDLPLIKGNAVHFKQVMSNLISNGIKYNDNRPKKIEIDFKCQDDIITFSVKDNGEGIDKRMHNKIFELFQTLHSKDVLESSGVGLAIVKKIVEENHGQIWLDSTEGVGTTFYFTWPLKEAKQYERKQSEVAGTSSRR